MDKNEGLCLVRCAYFVSSFGRFLSYYKGQFHFVGRIASSQYGHVSFALKTREGADVRRHYPKAQVVLREFSGGPLSNEGWIVDHINHRVRDLLLSNLRYLLHSVNSGRKLENTHRYGSFLVRPMFTSFKKPNYPLTYLHTVGKRCCRYRSLLCLQ